MSGVGFSRGDFSLWGVNRQRILTFEELEQVDTLTFSFELMNNAPFEFSCNPLTDPITPKELPLDQPLYEIVTNQCSYYI
jgi:hypothetical protein